MTSQTNLNKEPSQEIPDNNATARFNNNLKALKEHAPHTYEAIRGLITSCYVEALTPEIIEIRRPNREKPISISAEQRRSAIARMQKPDCREPISLVIGVGAGDELRMAFYATQLPIPELPNYKLPIYVVEPEPAMLIAAMWLQDMRELIESKRVQWFIGEQATNELADYLQSSEQTPLPTHYISHWYPDEHPTVSTCRQNITEITNKNSITIYRSKMGINKYYNSIDRDEWRNIFTGKNRPLRVMGWTSRFTTFLQYCMRDLLAGFDALGHETLLHIEESDIKRTTQQSTLASIDAFKPDLLIMIDHFRHEYAVIPKNLPFVNWIQDLLPNILNPSAKGFTELDFTYVFATEWVELLKNIEAYKGHEINMLHLGINPEIYHPIDNTQKTFDVLYVSHLVKEEKTLQPIRKNSDNFQLNAEEKGLFDTTSINTKQLIQIYRHMTQLFDKLLVDELWQYAHENIRRPFVAEILEKVGLPTDEFFIGHFTRSSRVINDLIFTIKTRPLNALIRDGVDVRIYGRHWNLLEGFSNHSHGPIGNGQPLNLLMNQARICLNNSAGTSLHMRALETLGAGSFMLNRDIPQDISDIRQFMTEGHDVFFFKNEIDIVEKVKYWIEHETEREQSAMRAHTKSLKQFSYKNLMRKLQGHIQSRLGP